MEPARQRPADSAVSAIARGGSRLTRPVDGSFWKCPPAVLTLDNDTLAWGGDRRHGVSVADGPLGGRGGEGLPGRGVPRRRAGPVEQADWARHQGGRGAGPPTPSGPRRTFRRAVGVAI